MRKTEVLRAGFLLRGACYLSHQMPQYTQVGKKEYQSLGFWLGRGRAKWAG